MTFPMRLIAMLVLLLVQAEAYAEIDSVYLSELQTRARQMKLAERPEWLKLIHYMPRFFVHGYKGQVDSGKFYLAQDGKTNPQSELDATLASFYSDITESDKIQNPQCAFVARHAWLNAQLKFDAARLKPQSCRRYEQWHAALNPSGLTLVFASAYLNSPSSMYGHTLIRVDAKDQNEQTRLLAYSVSFAASTTETNGLAFAINGLFGGYPGEFSILPYYAKVREYSDIENRDIWEYQLKLAPEEVDRVLMHAWELGPQYFDYFFFDENCAYHLLGLLQVARPEFEFTKSFPGWAIPSDTMRAITGYPDLVTKTVYRPAQATLLHNQLKSMSAQEKELVRGLSLNQISPADSSLAALPVARTAAVLETSYDYVNYQRATGKMNVADAGPVMRQLQSARSHLDYMSPPVDPHEPKTKPDEGHPSSRVAFGAGRRDALNFQEMQIRATYHDLMDQDAGYVRGAQIEFFDMSVRHYANSSTRVERVTAVDILSLSPRDDFFHPTSWKVSGGLERVQAARGGEPLAWVLDGGAGGAWSNERDTAFTYAMLDISSRLNRALDKGYALGTGASVGSYVDGSTAWRIHPYARAMRYFGGQLDSVWNLGLEQRISLSRDSAIRLDIARKRELKNTYNTATASILVYF